MEKILVVYETAETEENKALLQQILIDAGYQVIYAQTGEEAIEIAQAQQPCLIFMGVLISGIDGFKTTREITRSFATKHIPVVFMYRDASSAKFYLQMTPGTLDYIIPPYSKQNIIKLIHNLMS